MTKDETIKQKMFEAVKAYFEGRSHNLNDVEYDQIATICYNAMLTGSTGTAEIRSIHGGPK